MEVRIEILKLLKKSVALHYTQLTERLSDVGLVGIGLGYLSALGLVVSNSDDYWTIPGMLDLHPWVGKEGTIHFERVDYAIESIRQFNDELPYVEFRVLPSPKGGLFVRPKKELFVQGYYVFLIENNFEGSFIRHS